jgi:prepilin-type N-terminal cleavage/methylation domain-containing protein
MDIQISRIYSDRRAGGHPSPHRGDDVASPSRSRCAVCPDAIGLGAVKRRRRSVGFTLIEVLVAIAIMAAMATVIGRVLGTTLYQSAKARTDQAIRMLINRDVDFYTLVPYSELNTGSSTEGGVGTPAYLSNPIHLNGSTSVTVGMYPYSINRSVTIQNAGLASEEKDVTLTFGWAAPNPDFASFMSSSTVPKQYSVKTIKRYP